MEIADVGSHRHVRVQILEKIRGYIRPLGGNRDAGTIDPIQLEPKWLWIMMMMESPLIYGVWVSGVVCLGGRAVCGYNKNIIRT